MLAVEYVRPSEPSDTPNARGPPPPPEPGSPKPLPGGFFLGGADAGLPQPNCNDDEVAALQVADESCANGVGETSGMTELCVGEGDGSAEATEASLKRIGDGIDGCAGSGDFGNPLGNAGGTCKHGKGDPRLAVGDESHTARDVDGGGGKDSAGDPSAGVGARDSRGSA